uniref:Uncharacterized protein n=1 Tax=Zea mays TaxID=4577 RepID=C4J915_MAIZE|nr:unknown [Zea mays]
MDPYGIDACVHACTRRSLLLPSAGRLPLACWLLRGVNSLQGAGSRRGSWLVGGLQCWPFMEAGLLPWCRPLGVHLPLLLRRPITHDHSALSLSLSSRHSCMHDSFSSCSSI